MCILIVKEVELVQILSASEGEIVMTGNVIRKNQLNLLSTATRYLEESSAIASELDSKGLLKDDSLSFLAEISADLDYLKSLGEKQLHLEEILDILDIIQATRDSLATRGTIYAY